LPSQLAWQVNRIKTRRRKRSLRLKDNTFPVWQRGSALVQFRIVETQPLRLERCRKKLQLYFISSAFMWLTGRRFYRDNPFEREAYNVDGGEHDP